MIHYGNVIECVSAPFLATGGSGEDFRAGARPPESLTLRVTVIGGQRGADDFGVIWRGLPIGRIMRASGVPHDEQQWSWNCYLYGRPARGKRGADVRPDFSAHRQAGKYGRPRRSSQSIAKKSSV